GWQCSSSYDCPGGYACSNHTCVSNGTTPPPPNGQSCNGPYDCPTGDNCGSDHLCHVGDCSNSGCPSGYTCKLQSGALQCVGSWTTPRDGGSDTGTVGEHSSGKKDATCVASLGAGAKCLSGTCVKPADQCSD